MSTHQTALDAKNAAQQIIFAPLYFQAVVALQELGLLEALGQRRAGSSLDHLLAATSISRYGAEVLLEAGCCIGVVAQDDVGRYHLTPTGRFLRSDPMTVVNLNFVKAICYTGMADLTESIRQGQPVGLRALGDWATIYEGLSQLSPKARAAWLAFDHYYSDTAFPAALEVVFERPVGHLFDLGGNTGRWARACCAHDPVVQVTMVDLPPQLAAAKAANAATAFDQRIHYQALDLLDPSAGWPCLQAADAIWMSQLLDCFSPAMIRSILGQVYRAAGPDTAIYILEPLVDNQRFEASRFCLVGASLYFTAIANGNSRFYDKAAMEAWATGFEVVAKYELIGDSYHTLLHLRKPATTAD